MPGHSRKKGQHTPHAPIGDVRDPESLYHYLQRFLAWLSEPQPMPLNAAAALLMALDAEAEDEAGAEQGSVAADAKP